MATELLPGITSFTDVDVAGALPFVNTAMSYMFFVLIIAAFFLIGIKKKWFKRFDGTADIFKMYGGTLSFVESDKVRREKNKEKEFYEFKNRNIEWQPPSFENFVPLGGKKFKLYLRELSKDTFEVIDMKTIMKLGDGAYKGITSEIADRRWQVIQSESADQKWKEQDKWQRLRDAAPTIIVGIVAAIIIYAAVDGYTKITALNSGVSGMGIETLKMATEMLNKSMEYMSFLGYHPANATVIP